LEGVWKQAIQRKNNLVLTALSGDRQRQRQTVAPDAAKAAFGLSALHINYDAHDKLSVFLIAASSTTVSPSF
jgi:hypothetical protein